MPKKIKKIEPENFQLQTSTVWSFPNRGDWATHNGKYPGNFSPYIPRNLLLRYTKAGDLVLDQFCGSGTTMVECKLLERNAIGVDINTNAIEITKDNLDFEFASNSRIDIVQGDACNLDFIKDNSIDFICTHPPYANIIKFSENTSGDLSHLNIEDFYTKMNEVASESYRVLKPGKYCSILIGDTRKNKKVIPMGITVMNIFINAGFKLKEIIIKQQFNCNSTGFWAKRSEQFNFLLIMHEYLYVFEK